MSYFVKYPIIEFMIYHRKKVMYFSSKNAITLMTAKKGKR
jgi:hypothetical protein